MLPGQAKEKPSQAEVVAVGPGGVVDGKEVTMQVKPGDKVIYSKYAGTEVKLDDEEYIVVKQVSLCHFCHFLSGFGYKKTAVKCSIFTTVCFKFYLVLGITTHNKL